MRVAARSTRTDVLSQGTVSFPPRCGYVYFSAPAQCAADRRRCFPHSPASPLAGAYCVRQHRVARVTCPLLVRRGVVKRAVRLWRMHAPFWEPLNPARSRGMPGGHGAGAPTARLRAPTGCLTQGFVTRMRGVGRVVTALARVTSRV